MREISCPICELTQRELVFADTLPPDFAETTPPSPYASHYRINRCASCSLIYSSPIMDAVGIATLYRDSSETNVAPGEEDNVRRTMAKYYHRTVPYLPGRSRMLDVGCDMGFLLEAAATDGFEEVHGIEPNPTARVRALRIPGARIADGFYGSSIFPLDHFDLIAMIHVLDHLAEPRIVLLRALRDLRPGGVIIAVVHNIGSLLARVLGERFPVYNLYHHFFFDKRSLAELFRRLGFEVLEVVSTSNCYSLGFFAQRTPGIPPALRSGIVSGLETLRLSRIPVSVPVGNIGIVARRPRS